MSKSVSVTLDGRRFGSYKEACDYIGTTFCRIQSHSRTQKITTRQAIRNAYRQNRPAILQRERYQSAVQSFIYGAAGER